MKFSEELANRANTIRAYDTGQVQVNERVFTSSLIVSPEHLDPDWAPERFEEMESTHFEGILSWEPEIVLIGTGRSQRFPAVAIRRLFADRGIGMEAMDTAAACRTYNIILLEGRRVAAALLMIE